MATETVYKVVRNRGGVLLSAVRGVVVLAYRVGVPTTACAELPEAGPLAFHTHDDAVRFAKFEARLSYQYNTNERFEVYEAEAVGARPIQTLARNMSAEQRRAFWQDPSKFSGIDVMDAPRGTLVTASLTLVKKVWDSGEV